MNAPSDNFIRLSRNPDLALETLGKKWRVERSSFGAPLSGQAVALRVEPEVSTLRASILSAGEAA